MLAGISHDVRTPLNSILGIAALLLDGELEETQRRWVQRIRASCELLLAMLNGMLETCSAHADGTELNADDVDVASLVREVCEVLQPQAHDKGLDLRVTVEDAALGAWRTDPTRVRQVLANLLSNAVKYTERGGITLRVLHRDRDGRAWAVVDVADTGHGIPEDEQARVFEEFHRLEAGQGAGGTGIGLAISQQIAATLGGRINLESTPGAGSSFSLWLPLQAAARPSMALGA